MTRPILIVPGLNGSGPGHWQHYFLADHDNAELVEQADWANPQAGRWLHRLEQAVIANPGALIIGHSLGSILAARLATSSVASLVGGALLVAPADIERTSTLHARSYEFGTIPTTPLPFPALVVASRDDVYMQRDKARDIAAAWRAPFLDIGNAGHINIASGFGRWAQADELVDQVSVRIDRRATHRRLHPPPETRLRSA